MKLTCTEEDGKDVYRLRGVHTEKCKGEKGISPEDVTYRDATEHIDVTGQFKRRFEELAMERLWQKPMEIYKVVTEEFCRAYPMGAIKPTSRQVSLLLVIVESNIRQLNFVSNNDLC